MDHNVPLTADEVCLKVSTLITPLLETGGLVGVKFRRNLTQSAPLNVSRHDDGV